ncbi:MAG: HNH endonuclease [Acidimicrobiales bacterium]
MSTPYAHPDWKPTRLRILERDAHRCQINLAKCRIKATAVDHIVDWRDGGSWFDPDNLRAACVSCNTSQRNTRVATRARAHRGEPTPTPVSRWPGATRPWEHPSNIHGPLSWCGPDCPAQHPQGRPAQ